MKELGVEIEGWSHVFVTLPKPPREVVERIRIPLTRAMVEIRHLPQDITMVEVGFIARILRAYAMHSEPSTAERLDRDMSLEAVAERLTHLVEVARDNKPVGQWPGEGTARDVEAAIKVLRGRSESDVFNVRSPNKRSES